MKQVYLVYMKGWTINNNYCETVWAIFSNKRKAQTYARFKTAWINKEWLIKMKMKEAKWEVSTKRICHEDFTSILNIIKEENKTELR